MTTSRNSAHISIEDLTGEQRLVLTLPPREPVLIRGAAGSGKTTVAVHRAHHLYAMHGDLFRNGSVGIFTYTKALVAYVRSMLPHNRIEATTIHSAAWHILKKHGHVPNPLRDEQKLKEIISTAVRHAASKHATSHANHAILQQPVDFYQDEITWIKGLAISSFKEYSETERRGRGTTVRVIAVDRPVLWDILINYNSLLKESGHCDWDDVILEALAIASRPTFAPYYTHLVVDEVQDCTLAQLRLIGKLISPETNSITLVGDSAQRIYQSGFSWADTGIRVVGARSREFRKNYRNTRQIAEAAVSLLSHEEERSDFTETVVPEREGSKPRLHYCQSSSEEASLLIRQLQDVPATETACVAAPSSRQMDQLAVELGNAGFRVRHLKPRYGERFAPDGSSSRREVFISTMHSIKGLQADHVFLCGLCHDSLPPVRQSDDPEAISLARKLLYVGMTRAARTLTLSSYGRPSRLLDEINPETVETVKQGV